MLQVSDLACPKEKDARRHAGADTGAGDAAQCRQGLGAPTERRLSKIAHPHVNLQRLVYQFKPACEPGVRPTLLYREAETGKCLMSVAQPIGIFANVPITDPR
jgi:hypothetical protein